MTTLTNLLNKGVIGEIRLGMKHSEVIKALGSPCDTSLTKCPILRYGSLEITFRHGEVIHFQIDFNAVSFELPNRLMLSGWFPTGATSLEEFEAHISPLGIVATHDPRLSFDSQKALTFNNEVTAIFGSNKAGDGFVLDSIHVSLMTT